MINVVLIYGIIGICFLMYKVYADTLDKVDRYFIMFFLSYTILDILRWIFTDIEE